MQVDFAVGVNIMAQLNTDLGFVWIMHDAKVAVNSAEISKEKHLCLPTGLSF